MTDAIDGKWLLIFRVTNVRESSHDDSVERYQNVTKSLAAQNEQEAIVESRYFLYDTLCLRQGIERTGIISIAALQKYCGIDISKGKTRISDCSIFFRKNLDCALPISTKDEGEK